MWMVYVSSSQRRYRHSALDIVFFFFCFLKLRNNLPTVKYIILKYITQ